jgi:hypothetical protein
VREKTARRPVPARLLVSLILARGETHSAATGRWPNQLSGTAAGAPGERWKNLDQDWRYGIRGLLGE